jgi:hypothetical protein
LSRQALRLSWCANPTTADSSSSVRGRRDL